MAAGTDEQRLGIAWQVLRMVAGQKIPGSDSVRDPRLIPMLVGLLSFRHSIGSMGVPSGSVSITIADEAMQSLVFLTNHNTGYDYEQPERKRFAAIDKWLTWWHVSGSHKSFPKRSR